MGDREKLPGAARDSDWFVPVAFGGPLSEWVELGWKVTSDGPHALVPDGSVDLVWTPDGRTAVCGTEDVGWDFALPAGQTAVGVRLRPGLAPSVLGVPADAMTNERVPLRDVLGRLGQQVASQLNDATSDDDRLRLLGGLLARLCADAEPDAAALAGMAVLDQQPALRVTQAAKLVGMGERQFRRRVVGAFGVAPAVVRRVHRLHRFLVLGRSRPAPTITELAHAAGYHDHQHLVRDARAIGRATPSALLGR